MKLADHWRTFQGFQVPPAELESVLLTHPDIADAAVIGVESVREATELPRAYIVPARPDDLVGATEKTAFALSVQKWITTEVARHKFLRGGVVVIEAVPKRYGCDFLDECVAFVD